MNFVVWLSRLARVYVAKRRMRKVIKSYFADADLFSFGAVDIDPKHSAIWITTKTDKQRDLLKTKPELVDSFRSALLNTRYPTEAVPKVGFEFESQETVDRNYGGSWWLAIK